MIVGVESLQEECREWLATEWRPDRTLREWWAALFAAGFTNPTMPEGLGGRGLSRRHARVILEELGATGAIGPPRGVGAGVGIQTVLAHATTELQAQLVPPVLRGEDMWVQLFSEPGSGSDLASLATRAVADGDEYIVTGQKVWSSGADRANRGLLLARTDPDVPKRRGLSYFVIDLDQPGVNIRPMKCMNGDEHFCEVFLDEARVPAGRMIGDLNGGWRIAQTTLALERGGLGGAEISGLRNVMPGEKHGMLDVEVGEILTLPPEAPLVRPFFSEPGALIEMARARGLADDPRIRQRLMDFHIAIEVMRFTAMRVQHLTRAGQDPGAAALTGKLALGDNIKRFRSFALELQGPAGQLRHAGDPFGEDIMELFLWSFAGNIGGGTDEIQRNVIGERGLGLPHEPSVDRDVPYRELKVGTQRD